MQESAKIIMLFGLILLAGGFLLWLAGDKMSWLGHLPGDIRLVRGPVKIYIPITSMLLLSLLINLLIFIVRIILEKI
jgi:hypothetical protein